MISKLDDKSDVCVVCKKYGDSYDRPIRWAIKVEIDTNASTNGFMKIFVEGFCNVHSHEHYVRCSQSWTDLPWHKLSQFQACVVMFK